ncbi:hypothetical protein cypCar_00014338, partial [Cyprinus carpio]
FCGMIVYSWWGNKVRSDFVDPYYLEQKFTQKLRKPPTYMTAHTRRTYMLPGSSRPTTVIIPPSHQSYSESRGTRASGGRRGTQESQFPRTLRPLVDSAV